MSKYKAVIVFFVLMLLSAPAAAQDGGNAVPKPAVVDEGGKFVIDPSKNVLDLVLAAVKRLDDIMSLQMKRQDDMRAVQDRALETELKLTNELSQLRFQQGVDARQAEARRIDDEMKLRAEYNDRLTIAEAKRIDAIRAVDVNAVTVASQRASDQALALQKKGDDSALVLSAQVTKSADDVRTLVKTTADEQSRNLQQQFGAIQLQFTSISTRLTALEQTGAEGAGRQKFQDPALAALIGEVQKVSRTQAENNSANSSRSDLIGWIVGGIMLLIAIGTFAIQAIRKQPQQRVDFEPRTERVRRT